MNSIYMNHYVNIMHSFEEKGKDDIPTDEELLLFSESEDEEKELKNPKKISKLYYNMETLDPYIGKYESSCIF